MVFLCARDGAAVKFFRLSFLLSLILLRIVCIECADAESKLEALPENRSSLRFTPVNLRGGSKLTIVSPTQWSEVADDLLDTLRSTHSHFNALFGEIPPVKGRIRLMEENEFFSYTGAPSWTNAMYFRGEVLIPLSETDPIDLENLHRSLRHEYTHAVVSALSNGRAPGYIDEGIAQWAEGSENIHLKRVLKSWISQNGPLGLNLLQSGFTKLDQGMVPAAYAQSLFAAHSVLNTFGLTRLTSYFKNLRDGLDRRQAFKKSFGVEEIDFEEAMADKLSLWAYESRDRKSLISDVAQERLHFH